MKYLKQHPINDKAQKLSKLKKEDARKAKEKKMSAEKDLAEKPKTGRATTDPSNKKLDGEKFLAESKDENKINWKEVESKWDKWYEESNNEAFTGGGLSSTPPQTLEEQIAFSLKWYPRLYDSKWGRMKVLHHMYLGYGTEYEWEGGKLINFNQNNNDYDMYEYRYRVWQSRKKENEERLNREMDHYENMCGIFDRTINKPGATEEEKAEGRKYLKRIQDDINKLQDEIDNFDPYGKEYPDEKPLDCNKLHYSNYSPIFNLPEDITPEYLEGAKEIVKYVMDNTTNDKVWSDFEPIAKKLNVI